MESAVKLPLCERINVRMLVFIGVIAVMIGYPIYVLIDSQLTGGVKDIGGGYKQVDLKAMSTFTLDQTEGALTDIPEKWRALNGQKVVVYGEMVQSNTATSDIADFDLCYSRMKCCVSGPPMVQHFVQSKVAEGKTVEYDDGRVKVTGTLHVDVKKSAGHLASIYQLDVDSVESTR